MKIHLIRDIDIKEETYNEVVSFLNNSNGLMKFVGSEETYEEVKPKSHQDYFDVCNEFRKDNKIKETEIVVFLSATSHHYFGLPDFINNIYVKTSSWSNYLDSEVRFPIINEIVTNIFHMLLFNDLNDLQRETHMDEDRGCLNDYNLNKKGVVKRMKHPKVCDDCMKLIEERKLFPAILSQIFEIVKTVSISFDNIQKHLKSLQPSTLIINGSDKLYLPDYNYHLGLSGIDKVAYIFFLKHQEGVRLKDIVDYKEEVKQIFCKHVNYYEDKSKDDLTVSNFCDYTHSSQRDRVRKIKTEFENILGSALAKHYILLKGDEDKFRITIDRELVEGLE